MNNLDKQYQALLKDILSYGVDKNDRTGTGTKSIFGYMIHHNMQNGFPLLTTKKMPLKTIAVELMWFLMGDTNIKYLVDNGVHIWDGDAYKNYLKNHKDNLIGCTIVLSNGVSAEIKSQHNVNRNVLITTKGFINIEGDKTIKILNDTLTQEEFINKIKTDDEFAKKWGDLGPIYGAQWRNWTLHSVGPNDSFPIRVDQIKILIEQLKTNPDSRRLMVNAWNVGELDEMTLPPCHYGFQVYTRELSFQERLDVYDPNKLYHNEVDSNFLDGCNVPKRSISLSWNQRSVDVFLGLPFNIASYGLLLEMIAREVNMVPEHLIGHLGDTHLYLNHLEQAEQQLERIPRELPTLKMSSGHNFRAALKGKADEIDVNDFILINYNPHPHIKAPLSN